MKGNGWKEPSKIWDKYKKGQEIKYTVVETTNVDGLYSKRGRKCRKRLA
ncbi:MAG: hypothetical protein ACLU6Y_06535 [Ruminococcus sp.]